jgi:hypothetical protein
LVEHHLAKVDVESSSLFARSILRKVAEPFGGFFLCPFPFPARWIHVTRRRFGCVQQRDAHPIVAAFALTPA